MGRAPPVVSFPLTGGGASVEVAHRHFARLEADLQGAMVRAGGMFDEGLTLEQMHNRQVESEVAALRRMVREVKGKMAVHKAGSSYSMRRMAFKWWVKAHGKRRRMEGLVRTRKCTREMRVKKGVLRYWRVGRAMGRIVDRARGCGRRAAAAVIRSMDFLCMGLAWRGWRGVVGRFRAFWRRRREADLAEAAPCFHWWRNRRMYAHRTAVAIRRRGHRSVQAAFTKLMRWCFVMRVGVRRTRVRVLRDAMWRLKKHGEWSKMDRRMRKEGAFRGWKHAMFLLHCAEGDASGRAWGKAWVAVARCIRAWDELMERTLLTKLMNEGRIEALKTRLITAPMSRQWKRQNQKCAPSPPSSPEKSDCVMSRPLCTPSPCQGL